MQERVRSGNRRTIVQPDADVPLWIHNRATERDDDNDKKKKKKKEKRRRRKQQQQQQAGSYRCVVMTAARRAADGSLEYHGSIAKPHFSRNWKD